jgi:hypothetical protein
MLVLALLGGGCTPRASFEVTVVNQTMSPLTVGLVKDGPPFEREWATPDEVALRTGGPEGMAPWGHVVPAGRTVDSPAVSGAFPEGTAAYLRLYRGERPNSELLAISSPSPDRAEVLLFPGWNEVVVTEDLKGIKATRVRRGGAPAAGGR